MHVLYTYHVHVCVLSTTTSLRICTHLHVHSYTYTQRDIDGRAVDWRSLYMESKEGEALGDAKKRVRYTYSLTYTHIQE